MANEKIRSALLRILQFLAATAGFFLWWAAMLLLVSLIAVSVWKVSFTEIILLSLGFTVLSDIVYLFVLIRRSRKMNRVKGVMFREGPRRS